MVARTVRLWGDNAPVETMKYKTVEYKRLRKVEGYCTTKAGLFKFKMEVYGITVEVIDGGRPMTLRFRCEVGEDATRLGSPAIGKLRRKISRRRQNSITTAKGGTRSA